MRAEFLPFTKPCITEEDIAAVGDVLRSGWITNGPKNVEFEQKICEYTGNKHGVALASATGGMHLLMKALHIGPGDEVITPSLTWVSTVNMIVLAGGTPVFAEVDRDTLMVTPESVAACITPRTKLIIPVHYAGAAADLDGQPGGDGAGDVGPDGREPHVPQGELPRDAVDEVEGAGEDDEEQGTVDDDDEITVQDTGEDQDLDDRVEDRSRDEHFWKFEFIHAISPKSYRRSFRRECHSASGGGRR